jgi:hypothetical protein
MNYHLTLTPLLNLGPAALIPDAAVGVVNMTLRKVVLIWNNAFHEETTRKADDLFACAASNGKYYDAIPKGAELASAAFDIQFEDSPEPHSIEIAPPSTLLLQKPSDAPRIQVLLMRRGFRVLQNVALALILASAAFGPDGCLDDDTDDDSERARCTYPQS